jgi:hypothetical protein
MKSFADKILGCSVHFDHDEQGFIKGPPIIVKAGKQVTGKLLADVMRHLAGRGYRNNPADFTGGPVLDPTVFKKGRQ